MPNWMRELYLRIVRDSESLEDIHAYFSNTWQKDIMPFGFLNKKLDDTPREKCVMLFSIQEFLSLKMNHPYADKFDFQQRVWPSVSWRIIKGRAASINYGIDIGEITFTAVGDKL